MRVLFLAVVVLLVLALASLEVVASRLPPADPWLDSVAPTPWLAR